MLKNLKNEIDPRIIGQFDMGSIDAWDDDLLVDCFCETSSFDDFLSGKKEFLVGAKGAGKSAIFRLLTEGKKSFSNPRKLNQIVIPINEVMEYTATRALIDKKLNINHSSGVNIFFYFWEIYCLYIILRNVREKHPKIYSKLDSDANSFMSHFEESKSGFFDFLRGIKGSAGVKLDMTNPNLPVPDFYVSAEKAADSGEGNVSNIPLIKIDSIKTNLCKALRESKHAIYVLVDNLDDFASREEFNVQKEVIQGLVESCKYYTKFPELKIKAALRPELYEKLNFAQLSGRDKIEPRTVHIQWKNDDIRRFIAERLLVNLSKFCVRKGKHILISVDEEELYRPHYQKGKTILSRLFRKIKSIHEREKDIRDARTVDLKDHLYQSVITSIFPREIKHYNNSGKLVDGSDIFDYLSTHFCFSSNNATPRIYMRYISIVISVASEKYSKNEPENISLDENGEYPLIKRDFMVSAYRQLQDEARKNCISSIEHEPWRRKISLLLEKQGKRTTSSFRNIKKNISEESDQETKEFLAYCMHLGIVYCENNMAPLEQRRYEFPVLFQKIWG